MKPTKACFKHNRVDEGNGWISKPDMNTYMLWVKRPILCKGCDICVQEQSLRDTLKSLREQEE